MIKEELKKEAEEKAGIYFDNLDYDHGNVSDTPFSGYDVFVAYKKGALDFAEPREKHIAELEAEVKEWKDKADLWCKTANLKDHNIMINKELEKENAELKALLNCNNCSELSEEECEVCAEYSHFKCKRKGQLTKAKELIEQFLNDYPIITKDLLDKLEQFISEMEK